MRRPRSRFTSPFFFLGTIVLILTGSRSAYNFAVPDKTSEAYADSLVYGTICKKAPDSSCQSDTSRIFSLAAVAQVTVSYRLTTGRVVADSFAPGQVEAIFFTMSAANRMLLPYHRRMHDATYVKRERRWMSACQAHVTHARADTTCTR